VTRARSRALRIQHVIAPAPVGGAESVVRALASGQSRNGHAVAVTAILSDGSRPPFLDALERDGVQVFRVAVATRSYLRERAEVAALCRRLGSDILHTHGYRADVVNGGLGRSLGIAAVTTVHGFTGGGAKNRFYESVQRRALRRFNAVVAVSRPLGDGLARSGVPPDRLHVIPNGWGDPGPAVDRAEARLRLGLESGGFHVAWVGRVQWEKGPDVLVDTLPHLGEGVTLHVIGDGPQARSLRARTAGDPRIRWHGLVPEAGRMLAAFDAFVLSSRTEGTPIVLLEAMAAALPVIATRVGGVPDVVTRAEAVLVPPSDPPALAAAIQAVRKDPAGAADRVRAARARLTKDFTIDRWLARYDDVYGAVLAPVAVARC
jgi:glycosyltransferase involved in cell wall biosynthesis